MNNSISQARLEEFARENRVSLKLALHALNISQQRMDKAAQQITDWNNKFIPQLTFLFQRYSGRNGNIDQESGFVKLFEDLGIINDPFLQLYFTHLCEASVSANFSIQELVLGFLKMGFKSIQEMQTAMRNLRDPAQYPLEKKYQAYSYYFQVLRGEKRKCYPLRLAIDVWQWCLPPIFPKVANFIGYCRGMPNLAEINVSQDLWNQVWAYQVMIGDQFERFQEDQAWPGLICDYVESMTRRNQ